MSKASRNWKYFCKLFTGDKGSLREYRKTRRVLNRIDRRNNKQYANFNARWNGGTKYEL